jgi:mandelamide amidase
MAPVIEAALAALRDAGCVLVEADIPDVEKLSVAATAPISFYESLHDLTRYLGESGSSLTVEDIVEKIASPDVKAIYNTFIVGPKAPTREAYLNGLENGRPALQAAYRNYFAAQNVSAIIFPTTPLPARPIGQDAEVELNGKKVSTLFTYLRNSRPASTAGIPGLSLPVGVTAQGLPVGLEFDALAGNDRSLLGLCLAAERVFGRLPAPML